MNESKERERLRGKRFAGPCAFVYLIPRPGKRCGKRRFAPVHGWAAYFKTHAYVWPRERVSAP